MDVARVGGDDRAYLRRAVGIARRGRGAVEPNPAVGCVLVREGRVVGEGWHRRWGGPHAEVEALSEAGAAAAGATAYVSLEPCRHVGKTPACTDALLRAGVARLVFGAADPGAEAGGGADVLRAAGIEVVGPVLAPLEAHRENPAFFHRARTGRPFVALKLAVSLDGRIAAARGERTALTGPEARRRVHALRARHDAVLVGAATARVDDPLLTVREDVALRRQPTRVVLDGGASLSPDARLLDDVPEAPLLVLCRADADAGRRRALEARGAEVVPVASEGPEGWLAVPAVLDALHGRGLTSVLVEGGAAVARALLEADAVERLHLLVAPRVLGEGGVPAVAGTGTLDRDRAAWIPDLAPRVLGHDVELAWDRRRPWLEEV